MEILTVACIIFFSSCIPLVLGFVQCYYPDGSIPTDYTYVPCTSGALSACCIPTEGDICEPNGLCYYPAKGVDFRGACTDKSWASDACPKICIRGFEARWTYVSPCDSNNQTWACSGSGAAVCEAGTQGVAVPTQAVVSTQVVATTASKSSLSPTSIPTTGYPTQISSKGGGGFSTSDKIALGCGIGIGLPTALASIWVCILHSMRNAA